MRWYNMSFTNDINILFTENDISYWDYEDLEKNINIICNFYYNKNIKKIPKIEVVEIYNDGYKDIIMEIDSQTIKPFTKNNMLYLLLDNNVKIRLYYIKRIELYENKISIEFNFRL